MTGPFDIMVIDPPWRFSSNSADKPGRNAMRHYPCMSDAEIAALPIRQIMARDSLLLMWVTAPMLERAMAIPPRWGFSYRSQLVWPKRKIGTGFWVRNRHEPVLLYRRGNFPCPRPAPFPDSIISGDQREHSRKPESLQDQIDRAWPDARKVEMFGRRERAGWSVIGNEVGKFDPVTTEAENG